MMDFKETNLPFEKDVFAAAIAFSRTGPSQAAQNHVVLMAQLINQATGGDAQIIPQAFLGNIPEAAYGILTRRFGRNMIDEAKEIGRHKRTGFAYLEDASPSVKIFAAAHAVAQMMEFDTAYSTLVNAAQAFRYSGAEGTPNLPRVETPDIKLFETIAKNRSGIESLDWLLTEQLEKMRRTLDYRLRNLGRAPIAATKFLAFEETSLPQEARIMHAYETLTSDPRATSRDIQLAMGAALLLASSPETNNPTVIAATLIDVGLPARVKDDMIFLQKRLEWDVVELLAKKSGDVSTTRELAKSSPEFQLLAVVATIAALHGTLKDARATFEMLASDETPSPAAPLLKQSTISLMNSRLARAQAVQPVADTIDAPQLAGLLNSTMKSVQAFVAANAPKPMLLLPAPKPEAQPKPRTGFNL